MPILQRFWKFLGDNGERIKLISGIFVAAYALNEYWARQQETTVTRALDYITVATGHEIMISRVATELFSAQSPMSDNITELWKGVSNCANLPLSQCIPNPEAMKQIEKIVGDNDVIKTHVHNLLNVYYDVGACAISQQCDARTICKAFFPEISGFYSKYYGYLHSFDEKWNIGKLAQLGRFVDMCEANKNYI